MECNKEEAMRAMNIAERKMQSKDFVGARRMALKAQQLFPGLENLTHMISVCDVHCAADVNAGSSEKDWYAILQVEINADEVTIKKQYRRLALLLHPDKNKFFGAEAAFKIIGEAQVILLDGSKRLEHNAKRNVARKGHNIQRHQSSNGAQKKFKNNPPQNSDATSQQVDTSNTFWTKCPFCHVKYEFYKAVKNKSIRCQTCSEPFIAYVASDASGSAVRPAHVEEVSCQRKNSSKENLEVPVKTTNESKNHSREAPVKAASAFENKSSDDATGTNIGKGGEQKSSLSKAMGKPQTIGGKKREMKETEKPSGGNGKVDATMEFGTPACETKKSVSQEFLRRSERKKQHVEYKEHGYDFENLLNPKRTKVNEAASCQDDGRAEQEANFSCNDGTPSGRPIESTNRTLEGQRKPSCSEGTLKINDKVETYVHEELCSVTNDDDIAVSYSEPEFYDFDQDRTENSFKANQIWALYDDREGMPRFYAKINRVVSSSFEVHFKWLELIPSFQFSVNWDEVPVACGTFKLGENGLSTDAISMFSFLVSWEKGQEKNTYHLCPRKGEVWALYKNWDSGWISDLNKYKNCELEIVEILSDYSKVNGVEIAYLKKVKGFVCLFQPLNDKGTDKHRIGSEELLRFSHRIPSYHLIGNERVGIPARSIELDPAAVPSGLEEFEPLSDVNFENGMNDSLNRNLHWNTSKSQENITNGFQSKKGGKRVAAEIVNESSDKRAACSVKNLEVAKNIDVGDNSLKEKRVGPSSVSHTFPFPSSYELPGSEFHNFETAISVDDFQPGQFWSLYSDEDGLPKYYARIQEVETNEFSVTVKWFELIPTLAEERHWVKQGLPAGCGTFRLVGTDTYDSIGAFSHQICPIPTARLKYLILPQAGETWVLYKNWKRGWSADDLMNSEYSLVEVRADSQFVFKVVSLEKVPGYRYVFRAVGDESEIPPEETLRFSHLVPSFQLTEERGGELRGYWELDPAALPEPLLSSEPEPS